MTELELRDTLKRFADEKVDLETAVSHIKSSVFRQSDLGFANLDHHRELRHGLGEVIYGEGKSSDQIASIASKLSENGRCVLATRLDEEKIAFLKKHFTAGRVNEMARTFMLNPPEILDPKRAEKFAVICSGGTSDMKVAEEAAEVCLAGGAACLKMYDVGVAGLHRILSQVETLQKASVVIAIAGMEGALPSVVGGLVGCPVIAVPTSVGYGASFQGLSALLAMLNSCAPGVLVTNIDAGFSAGFAALRIMRGNA